jgi:hypothetical protein
MVLHAQPLCRWPRFQIRYSQFQPHLDNDKIERVTVGDRLIRGQLKAGSVKDNQDQLSSELLEKEVREGKEFEGLVHGCSAQKQDL